MNKGYWLNILLSNLPPDIVDSNLQLIYNLLANICLDDRYNFSNQMISKFKEQFLMDAVNKILGREVPATNGIPVTPPEKDTDSSVPEKEAGKKNHIDCG